MVLGGHWDGTGAWGNPDFTGLWFEGKMGWIHSGTCAQRGILPRFLLLLTLEIEGTTPLSMTPLVHLTRAVGVAQVLPL